jgi:hypothetical protein
MECIRYLLDVPLGEAGLEAFAVVECSESLGDVAAFADAGAALRFEALLVLLLLTLPIKLLFPLPELAFPLADAGADITSHFV